jgi:hypothetical protein
LLLMMIMDGGVTMSHMKTDFSINGLPTKIRDIEPHLGKWLIYHSLLSAARVPDKIGMQ